MPAPPASKRGDSVTRRYISNCTQRPHAPRRATDSPAARRQRAAPCRRRLRVYLCTVPCDMGRGCDGLGRIAGHPVIQLDELLPANWKPATTWAPFQIQPACTRVKRDHLCARDAYVVSSSSAPAASACQPRSGGGSARLTERFYSLLERNAPSWLWTLFYLPTQFQQYRSQWLVRGDKDPAVFRAFA